MSLYPKASFLTSANRAEQLLPDSGGEVAFAGRSNAGKSSAINTILGRRDFARTSKTPGRTQLINFFALTDDTRLVDLPGYGYAKVSREMREHWRELLEDYFRSRNSLAGVMLVVDSRRGIGEFDQQMLDWADALGCPTHILLTKADKLSRREAAAVLEGAAADRGTASGLQLFSATTRLGVEQARQQLATWLERSPEDPSGSPGGH